MSKFYLFKPVTTTLTASLCACIMLPIEAQEPFEFHCKDYISTDEYRAPQSAFSYNEAANTFTIRATGQNNIAFKLMNDGDYYIEKGQKWYVIKGENLATTGNASLIWWFNGYNNGGAAPLHVVDNGDGSTILLWDIENSPSLNAHIDFTQSPILITGRGADFINAMGLTSTGNQSTITDVNYYTGYKAAAIYPSTMHALGFTPSTLTASLSSWTSTLINEAQELIQDAANGENKTLVEQAIKEAQEAITQAGLEGYHIIYPTGERLEDAMRTYKKNNVSFTWEKTTCGIHATLNDMHINLMFYSDNTVRICRSLQPEIEEKSLAIVAQPSTQVACEVNEDKANNLLTINTSQLTINYNLTTSQVEVLRWNGESLIKEKENGYGFLPCKDGPYDSYLLSQSFQLDAKNTEPIYGMGQIQDGKLNRRGETFSLAQSNTRVCIPYFQSAKNYAVYWDNYSPTTFTDNAAGTKFQSTGTKIDYYVIAGNHGDEVVAGMRHLTGKAPMPALWNFGLYQSKERYMSAQETMDVVAEYLKRQVPLDCIVQDWQYWGENAHWNALEFLNPSFSSYQEMIESVHQNNAKLMISIWANFGPDTRPYAELKQQGRIIPVESYPPGYSVSPYDAYGEKARDIYWKYLYDGLASKGIDAYWMDSSEPDYFNWQDADLDYVTEAGFTWRAGRNAFPLVHVGGVYDHHRAAAAAGDAMLNGKRVSILTRSAYAGQQRYGANTWSGDVTASWENYAAQIPAACNLSLCGIPYWNSDIGGFFTGQDYTGVNDPAWRRLYMRWMQFGTFTPMMRFHGANTPREIYQFGEKNDAQGDYDHILKYIKIRYRMLPYLYSTAWQVSKNDATFMRPLATAFSHDKATRNVLDEYMFGSSFLVAPIIKDNVGGRKVYLPGDEKWIDFWTGKTHEGGKNVFKTASTTEIPLYIKAGSILPWGPDVQYSTQKPWDELEVRIYPGANGTFTLYEDENDNYNYEQGHYTEIPFTWDDATQTLSIGARIGSYEGMLSQRTFNIVKVSTTSGTGDEHSKEWSAQVQYDGQAVSIKLSSPATSISSPTSDHDHDAEIYSIDGVKQSSLSHARKGIYIINGKKVAR